ncbi:hypothetical protein ACFQ4C_26965 [Larkinella insperata]|uniref:DUF3575 domain-containing protein n=1 Tax=Larkinella insperata TaxID=332158 RepID=A0ABW3QNV3_9BACT|nr:hypothetical protein [Larkinella insperata]
MNLIQKGLLAIMLVSSSVAYGQLTEDPEDRRGDGKEPLKTQTPEGEPLPFSQRLRFGGGISSLQFGNSRIGTPFIIGLSPVIAYQASERLIAGVGVNYVYYRYRLRTNTQTLTDQFNQYGGRGFLMYELVPSIVPNLYAHAEFENNNIRYADQAAQEYKRRWVTAPMIGATYSQRVGRLAGINLSILYNVNYNSDIYSQYVYGSPWNIRISFF